MQWHSLMSEAQWHTIFSWTLLENEPVKLGTASSMGEPSGVTRHRLGEIGQLFAQVESAQALSLHQYLLARNG